MEISAVISDIMGVLLLKDPHWQKDMYWEKRLGLPRGALFSALFDDREENILAAQQIGMHTILFEQNEQAIAALQSMLTD